MKFILNKDLCMLQISRVPLLSVFHNLSCRVELLCNSLNLKLLNKFIWYQSRVGLVWVQEDYPEEEEMTWQASQIQSSF